MSMSHPSMGSLDEGLSGSSVRGSSLDEPSFDFSDHDAPSSSSSDAEDEADSASPAMPPTPALKRPPSSPEIVITKATHELDITSADLPRQRPRMRLDFSNLPPAISRHSSGLSSPRPGLQSRFSSDDGLSSAAGPASGVTPGTESALNAFGIASMRGGTPAAVAYPTPPLQRSRRRFNDAFTPSEADDPFRPRPSPTASPYAPSPMRRTLSASSSDVVASPMRRSLSAASAPRSPLLDFAAARALYHSILPGDHRLLATGETPGVSVVPATSYFALSPS